MYLVSVSVITYNSEKTIIDTLESIYNQTYPNLELIVSDDCSTDNTVQVCCEWIEAHKERFARTELLTVEKNTGISANFNRAGAACKGEWVKEIAGDDLLLPDCVYDCHEFSIQHPDIKCFFGKIRAFGADSEYCNWLTNVFSERNDTMSMLDREELLHMITKGNTPPAPAFFYNRSFLIQNQIKNDERIPFIEDLPKWVSMLKKGIVFGFMDKEIVRYRVGGISTSKAWQSPELYRNRRLTFFYYQFDCLYSDNPEIAINDIVNEECDVYGRLMHAMEQLSAIKSSFAYKVGYAIISPNRILGKIWNRIRKSQL